MGGIKTQSKQDRKPIDFIPNPMLMPWEADKEPMKILLVYHSYSSFVKNDYTILSRYFDVKKFQWHGKKDLPNLSIAVKRSDLTFIWFADDHAAVTVFLSKTFGKHSVIVVGGYDVTCVPEIDYGLCMQSWHRKKRNNYALNNANLLIPFSNFAKNDVERQAKPKQMKVIYLGIDVELFKPEGEKENLIVTVGSMKAEPFKRKGLETFARASLHFPNHKFVIIGQTEKSSLRILKDINPDIISTGYLKDCNLLRWLQQARVYCQLSAHEGFGMALAESMACGCIPVVTDRGALPEVVGNVGFYTPYCNTWATVEAIEKALKQSDGRKSRERIINKFPLEKRADKLSLLLESVK